MKLTLANISPKPRRRAFSFGAAALACLMPLAANATIVQLDSWTTNEGDSGNYILTIDDNDGNGTFSFNLTVNPWNAEALGLFLDYGDVDLTADASAINVVTTPTSGGNVSVYARDTASNDCGNGCNLNGLSPPVSDPDGEWEIVFSLGTTGFEGIQTFSWDVAGVWGSILATDLTLAGIRAQNLCVTGETLPDGSCDLSDKSYSADLSEVPLPAAAWLFGSALLGIAGIGYRRTRQA